MWRKILLIRPQVTSLPHFCTPMIILFLLSYCLVLGLNGQELREKSHQPKTEKNELPTLQSSGDVTSGKQEIKNACGKSDVSIQIQAEPFNRVKSKGNLKNTDEDFGIQDFNPLVYEKFSNQAEPERTNNGIMAANQDFEARNVRSDLITKSTKVTKNSCVFTSAIKSTTPPNIAISTAISQSNIKMTIFSKSITVTTQRVKKITLIPENKSYSIDDTNITANIFIDSDKKSIKDLNNAPVSTQYPGKIATNGTRKRYRNNGVNLAGLYIPFCHPDSSCSGRCGQDFVAGKNQQIKDESSMVQDNSSNASPAQSGTSGDINASPILSRLCNCDIKCVIYGDCCADAFKKCWRIKTPESVEKFVLDTRHNSLLNVSRDNLVNLLRHHPDNAEMIVDAMYIHFASCRSIDLNDYRSKLFVSECPEGASWKLKEKCQNTTSAPPVTATLGSSQIIFINEFCAKCHGVNEKEFRQWTSFLVCISEVSSGNSRILTFIDIDFVVALGLCNVSYSDLIKGSHQRLCFSSEKLTPIYHQQLLESVAQNVCTTIDMLMCESYYFYMDFYRNPHCQVCLASSNRKHNTTIFYQDKNDSVPCKEIIHERGSGGSNFRHVFMIMDLSQKNRDISNQGLVKFNTPESECLDTEVFDQIIQKCKTVICPIGRDPHQGKCGISKKYIFQQKSHEFGNNWSGLDVFIQIPEVDFSCENFTRGLLESVLTNFVVNSVLVSHNQLASGIHGITKKPSDVGYLKWCTDSYSTNVTKNLTSITLNLTLAMDLDLKTWNQLITFPQIFSLEKYQATIVNVGVHNNSSCNAKEVVRRFYSFSVEDKDGLAYIITNNTKLELNNPLQSLNYRIHVEKENNDLYVSVTILICESTRLFFKANCNVIEYRMIEISFNKSQLIAQYGEDNIDIQGDKVYACSQSLPYNAQTDSYDASFIILSWTLTGMSVLCLLAMLVIYVLFPELCTLPGKLMASLAATMLLTHLLISLGTFKFQHEYLCPVAAAFTHFIVLAQFGWMSAIAVNMALTFGPNSVFRVKSIKSNKVFFRYNFIVWGLSLIIVMTAVALDFLYNKPLKSNDVFQCNNTKPTNSSKPSIPCSVFAHSVEFPHYGYKDCIWFAGSVWTTLAFVVIPFCLAYVINIVCFIITAVGIHKSTQRARKIGKTSLNRIQCLILIKMSTAMGFAWILDIPSGFVDSNSFAGYILIAFILLQGVFLFLAFMANKRVFRLIRERIAGWELSREILSSVSIGQ